MADNEGGTQRHFYALSHPYGADTTYGDPEKPKHGKLYAFSSRQERDEWVRGGPTFRSEQGYRTAISSDHVEVQRYYRAKRKGASHTVGVEVRHLRDGELKRVEYA